MIIDHVPPFKPEDPHEHTHEHHERQKMDTRIAVRVYSRQMTQEEIDSLNQKYFSAEFLAKIANAKTPGEEKK